ncbi:MAG: nitrate reductase cytochrome c-type subunit [Myxococcales bacterium]|nr:nitrate reductase cytochrome c-type subunit [Myxococcales bacterium]
MSETSPESSDNRLGQMALAVVLGLALTGFVVGVRAGPGSSRTSGAVPQAADMPRDLVAKVHGITTAKRYDEIGEQQRGVNAAWRSRLDLVQGTTAKRLPLKAKATHTEVLDAIAKRTENRAFDGAPPVVPHPVQQRGGLACLACHSKGVVLGKGAERRVASVMSHRFMTNCTQCHVEQVSARWGPANWPAESESTFVGLAAATHGPRSFESAPPQMPHAAAMRSACGSCHGPTGPKGLQTSHFDRQSCTQCHTSSAGHDQRYEPGYGPGFPAAP